MESKSLNNQKLSRHPNRGQNNFFHASVYHLSKDHESVKALFFMPLIPQTTEMCPAYSSQFSSSY